MRPSGWLTFSAVVLIVAGIMRVIDAIWVWSLIYIAIAIMVIYGLSAHYREQAA